MAVINIHPVAGGSAAIETFSIRGHGVAGPVAGRSHNCRSGDLSMLNPQPLDLFDDGGSGVARPDAGVVRTRAPAVPLAFLRAA